MNKIAEEKINKYIRAIRNDEKKKYALCYLDYLRGDQVNEPCHDNTLSYMGAQAVRMNLHELIKRESR
jgi:hypothetical protein